MQNAHSKTYPMILCALFTTLIIIGTFIKVPIPFVPFTLQFLFTTLAGILLGPKLGSISVLVYILLGLIGIPVFTEGGGLSYIFKPTFGYIIGFLVGTYITGKIARAVPNPSFKRLLGASFTGLFIVYLFGLIYFYLIKNFYLGTNISLWSLFLYCFILAVPGDMLLCFISSLLGQKLIPLLNKKSLQ
ncbi:biotin transporter BioY [Sporanaerobium hydrogeniformans]|uniref:Biotin transporter BioY n=1 Tax=Sporanaerobium hydrogeniformans TaxID=3072179 RepID=A0AC61D6I6_9FIRM|nr:biotin transporter BioY [Sporanaerobium hydrogeniformans]PHV69331.1 biotin transporter BioY [Sporanaerobium hydrogeniformans]